MREDLYNNGFYQYTSCQCGGTKTYKFKHPTFTSLKVVVKPNKQSFSLFEHDRLVRYGREGELKAVLPEYATARS